MLGLLIGPMGRAVALVAALFLWTAYQRHDAAVAARAELAAEYQKQTDEEIARQKAEGAAAIKAAEARAKSAESRLKALQGVADELTSEIEAAGGSCPVADDLRRRLLTIK